MSTIGTKYLFQCKKNYHNGIRPSCKENYQEEGYETLIEIAKEYFRRGKIDSFSNFFREYQYCVDLWTAHLIVEYGNPDKKLKKEALEMIKLYSVTPLNKDLAREEKQWLDIYLSKQKESPC